MIKSTIEILEETREELCGILDHISCMLGLEDELYVDLEKVEAKLSIIYKRLTEPVEQQLSQNEDDYAFMAQSEDI